jgi:DNA-binding MarR family transcriptional regulator
MQPMADADFQALLQFRIALRRFNRWSEEQARAEGLTHAQHQLLLAVKGHAGAEAPTIGEIAEALLLRHHSAVELVNRVQSLGFVERHRDGQDGRVVRLSLTDQGEQAISNLTALHVAELRQLAPLLRHVVEDAQLQHGPLG